MKGTSADDHQQRMAKARDLRRVTFTAISSMCLILFPLTYAGFFPLNTSSFDYWKKTSNWGGRGGDGASLSSSNMEHGSLEDDDSLGCLLRRLVRGREQTELDTTGFTCKSDNLTDVCVSNQNVRLDTRSLIVYLSSNKSATQLRNPRTVRPYARKNDSSAMELVRPVEIRTLALNNTTTTQGQLHPAACDDIHAVPAVVFSSGAYTGNLFHDFNDVIFPLFITCRQFRSRLRLVVTDYKPSWVRKYHRIISHLSDYKIINPLIDGRVHCFPAAVIGLTYHGNLACNVSDLPVGFSSMDFRRFLHDALGLKSIDLSVKQNQKPLLILLSRRNSRRFLNENELVQVADELGFRVMVASVNQTSNLEEFAGIVSSCSVLVGAHGAGLTNGLFLPARAVVVQVVPLGLPEVSTAYFGKPFPQMGIRYLEYRIRPEESTLSDLYGPDHPVIKDPHSIYDEGGYVALRATYVDGQDLKPQPLRFRKTLIKALTLLGYRKWHVYPRI